MWKPEEREDEQGSRKDRTKRSNGWTVKMDKMMENGTEIPFGTPILSSTFLQHLYTSLFPRLLKFADAMVHLHLILISLLLPFWLLFEILHLGAAHGVHEDDEPQPGGADVHEDEVVHRDRR